MKKKYDHTYPERNRKKTDTYNLAAQAAGYSSYSAILTALKNAYIQKNHLIIEINKPGN